jgi:hypothetical protein
MKRFAGSVIQWADIDGGAFGPAFGLLQLNDPENLMHTKDPVPLLLFVGTELDAFLRNVFDAALLSVMVNPTDSLPVLWPAKQADGLSTARTITNRSTLRLPHTIGCPYLERSCPDTGQSTAGHRNPAR